MIALYVRVSSSQQAEKYSLTTQIQKGMAFAQKEAEDFNIYQDIVSGKNIEDRARFEDLLADIRKEKIQKVWVVEQSRLNRNLEDALLVKRIFNEFKIRLFVDGVLSEFVTPEDTLKYNITSAVSEYERSQIIARSVRGKTEWQDSGNMAYPSVYGYAYTYSDKGKKNWYPVEAEINTVHLIYDLYVNQRVALNRIKIVLNDKGIKTKHGNEFLNSQVRAILRQSAYIGHIRSTKGLLVPSAVYVPVLDRDLWDSAQVELNRQNKPSNHFEQRPASYELSGLVRCAKCGAAFYYNENSKMLKGRTRKTWTRYYHSKLSTGQKECPTRVRMMVKENIELQVRNLMSDLFMQNDEMLGKWYRFSTTELQKEVSRLEEESATLIARLDEWKRKKFNLIDALSEGAVSKADIRDKMVELNANIDELSSTLKEKTNLIKLKKTEVGSEYQLSIGKLFLEFEDLPAIERRRLYMSIFPAMTLSERKLTVTLFDGSQVHLLIDNRRGGKKLNFPPTDKSFKFSMGLTG